MMRICVWAWTVIALASAAARAEQDFIPPEPLYAAGLVKYWQLALPLDKGQSLQDVYLVDDHLYLGTQEGYVYAVHAPTGALLWLRPVTRSGYHVRRPCHAGERVIFATPTDTQLYDRRTGDPLSRQDLRFPAGTAPVSDGALFFIGGLDRRLYAFDVETQYIQWRVIVDGPIASTPAMHGDDVFVANDAGNIYACTRARKVFRWQTATFDRISADLVVGEEGVYVACRDLSLYLLDFDFGNVRWRARFSGPLDQPPVVTREVVYQYSPADGLVAVEAAAVGIIEERFRWKLPHGRLALTVHAGRAYILTKNQTIVAVSIKDGTLTTTIPAPGFTLGMPAPESSTVFVASPDGRIFCARPLGVPPLQKADVLDALRPPGMGKELAAAASQPTTRPTAATGDPLAAKRRGPPIGGKSKISRQFPPGTGEESE